jgi:hypothetical protein
MSENRAFTSRFPKGVSGNPGGRPKIPDEVKKLFEQRGLDAVKGLFDLAANAENEKVRLEAIQEVLNRWLGKVPLTLEDDINGGSEIPRRPIIFDSSLKDV